MIEFLLALVPLALTALVAAILLAEVKDALR